MEHTRVLRIPPAVALVLATAQLLALADAKDACKCLNWKQVYKNDMAMCGEGLEYHVANPGQLGYKRREAVNAFAFAGNDQTICPDFLKKLDTDACINVGPYRRGTTDWTGMTWCYVSKDCDDLYGGKRLSENSNTWSDWFVSFINDPRLSKVSEISWKLCRPGKDLQLRDWEVEDLLKFCERLGVTMRYCVKAAYPGAWVDFLWPQVHWMWERRHEPEVFHQMPDNLKGAIIKQDPMVVDTQYGGANSDLVVVSGNEAHYLQFNPGDCPATQYCRGLIPDPQPEQPPQEASAAHQEASAEAGAPQSAPGSSHTEL